VRGTGTGGGEMRNIYVVRHTEAEHHVKNLAGGWYDTSLTEKGKEQAEKIAENLFKEVKITSIPIYSSDLKRCAEMADIISKKFKSKIILDRNLREKSSGEGDGKPKQWYDAHIIHPQDDNHLDYRTFKGAESRREVGIRAHTFLNGLLQKNEENTIIVTHGFFTTFLILAWMKIPAEHMDYGELRGHSGGVALLNEDDFWKNRNVIYTNRMDFLET
jgi:2,3-bisphosphoglycerate-dependent phosphoglycerate mutase